MSEISHSDELVTKQDLSNFYHGILPYLGGMPEGGYTPVGTIISVMGNSAPEHYLACNGQTVAIVDYPELASYFEEQFGSKNKFGGDGTTTFGIPDLRGEFLRGTGTNGHANQGSGANVGTHQDGTIHSRAFADATNISVTGKEVTPDWLGTYSGDKYNYYKYVKGTENSSGNKTRFTSRPTNTSVLYCIATKNIYMSPMNDYSANEKVVGHWVDGKTIYQKTVSGTFPDTTAGMYNEKNIATINNVDNVINIYGWFKATNNTSYGTLPWTTAAGYIFKATFEKTDSGVHLQTNAPNASTVSTYVTIQYTKSTD